MPADLEKQQQQAGLLEECHHDDAESSSTISSVDDLYDEKHHVQNSAAGILSQTSQSLHNFTPVMKKHIRSFAAGLIPAIVPSFLHTTILKTKRADPAPLHPTAYLDGLRGVAAFIVVVFHLTLDWYPSLGTGYHWESEEKWWAQYPFIRTLYSGRGMVSIFFVISGYVLTAKPLRQMRSSNPDAVFSTLSSSLFRRAFRLFLPIIPSTLLVIPLVRYDLFIKDPQNANFLPPVAKTLSDQLHHYFWEMWKLTDLYDAVGANHLWGFAYDGHLWTIPVEYRGSIVVFCTALVVAKCRSWLRPTIIFGTAMWNLCLLNWDLFLFLCGMGLAEVHNILAQPASTTSTFEDSGSLTSTFSRLASKSATLIARSPAKPIMIWGAAILAFLILGAPNDLDHHSKVYTQYGFATMLSYTPKAYLKSSGAQKYWLAIGAVLLTTSLSFSPTMRRPFESRIAQYLGFISYSLYLLHGSVLYTVGMWILKRQVVKGLGSWEWEGKPYGVMVVGEPLPEGAVSWEGVGDGFAVEYWKSLLVCLTLVIWGADVFTRFVDGPSVRLSGRIQRWAWGV